MRGAAFRAPFESTRPEFETRYTATLGDALLATPTEPVPRRHCRVGVPARSAGTDSEGEFRGMTTE